MTFGDCGCAAKARARSMVVGGFPGAVAPAVEGLATLSAMDNAHAISSWAARRLPPARGLYGDASGGNARGHVSEGGRYHPAGARVGSATPGSGAIGTLSGVAIAHRAIAALPDDMIAAQILRAWLKHNPSSAERDAAAAELVRLGYPHAAEIIEAADRVSDAGDASSTPAGRAPASSWARSRGASVGASMGPHEREVARVWTESPCHTPQLFAKADEACRNFRRQLAEAREKDRADARRGSGQALAPRASSWARRRAAPASRGVVVGGVVEDRIMQLTASWDTLKTDIFASPLTDATFRAAFMRDATVWQGFAASHMDDWIELHTTLDQVESYRQTLERWRAAFVALGGQTTGSPTTAPPPGLLERAGDAAERAAPTLGGVTDAVTAVAVAVGLVAVAWAVSSGASVAPRFGRA